MDGVVMETLLLLYSAQTWHWFSNLMTITSLISATVRGIIRECPNQFKFLMKDRILIQPLSFQKIQVSPVGQHFDCRIGFLMCQAYSTQGTLQAAIAVPHVEVSVIFSFTPITIPNVHRNDLQPQGMFHVCSYTRMSSP